MRPAIGITLTLLVYWCAKVQFKVPAPSDVWGGSHWREDTIFSICIASIIGSIWYALYADILHNFVRRFLK